MKKDIKYCECGCGTALDFSIGSKKKRFIRGHSIRVNPAAMEAARAKGPWNKGIPRSDKVKKKISQSQKASYESGERKEYIITEEHRKNLTDSVRGPKSPEHIRKIVESRQNNPNYEQTKKRISKTLKEKYKSGELVSSFYIDGRYKNDPNSSYNKYGGCFTSELKNKVRKRDAWVCQMCQKKRSAVVHHIDEDKLNNTENNLITLCKHCHAKHHHHQSDEIKLKHTNIFLKRAKNNEN